MKPYVSYTCCKLVACGYGCTRSLSPCRQSLLVARFWFEGNVVLETHDFIGWNFYPVQGTRLLFFDLCSLEQLDPTSRENRRSCYRATICSQSVGREFLWKRMHRNITFVFPFFTPLFRLSIFLFAVILHCFPTNRSSGLEKFFGVRFSLIQSWSVIS